MSPLPSANVLMSLYVLVFVGNAFDVASRVNVDASAANAEHTVIATAETTMIAASNTA